MTAINTNKIWIVVFAITLMALLGSCSSNKQDNYDLSSPNGKLHFALYLKNDQLFYNIHSNTTGDDSLLVGQSQLGLVLKDHDFSTGLKIQRGEQSEFRVQYQMQIGKRKENYAQSIQQIFSLENVQGEQIELHVRMFNEGFAFRYVYKQDANSEYLVEKELTQFQIPLQGKAWIEPYDSLQKWGPSHEVGYESDMVIGTTSYKSTGWAFPALFHFNNNWCLLSEADIDTTYCCSHLSATCPDGRYQIEFPWMHELYGMGDATPSGKGSFQTPWRIGIIGNELKTIVESNLIYSLTRPSDLGDMSWVKPGRVAWSWWGDVNSPTNVEEQKRYIDFAAEMRWEYSLIDANWHYLPEKDLRDLVEYATSKNVGILLWYNSAGPYTKVYEVGPLDRVHTHELRMKEFAWLNDIGVKGIKVDFFQSDKQITMKYYEGLARDCAKFGLLLNTHSSTIPRGFSRTFPNYISTEAVKGAEQYPQVTFTEKAAMWNTILPFTRNVIGPMDYTPVTFSDRGSADSEEPLTANKDNTTARRLTTNAHELALSVVFECGLQHFADRPASYRAQPKEVIQFLKDIPVRWDETYFIDGYPGQNIILARYREGEYFIGGINGQSIPKVLELNFDFLPDGNFIFQLISDGNSDRKFKIENRQINYRNKLAIECLPYGGFAGRVQIQHKKEISK